MTAPSPAPTNPFGIRSGCLEPGCRMWCVTWRGHCIETFDDVGKARTWIEQQKARRTT